MQEEKVSGAVEGGKCRHIEEHAEHKIETKAHQLRERIKHLLVEYPDIGRSVFSHLNTRRVIQTKTSTPQPHREEG